MCAVAILYMANKEIQPARYIVFPNQFITITSCYLTVNVPTFIPTICK